MHKVKFYPVNNGDCSQIVLKNGKRILMDYRQHSNAKDEERPEIDLESELKKELSAANKDHFEVVAFTHADLDHIEGSTEFFELKHAKKYQGDGRIKIDELWVPAAMLLEVPSRDEQSEEFAILRREAWHRLKENDGIKVFSCPDELKKQMEKRDIEIDEREHLFVDAGTVVDTFNLATDGVEFFCHSPFIKHVEGGGKEIRNQAALIFNVRFISGGQQFDYFANGDSEYGVLEDIVSITQSHGNDDRLQWDLFSIPHHCSYKVLSDGKGEKETIPKPKVKELLLAGIEDAYMICSSNPISDDEEAYEQVQPPHIQAKNTYKKYLRKIGGRRVLVTMEEPCISTPKPIIFELSAQGLGLGNRAVVTGASVSANSKPVRAG